MTVDLSKIKPGDEVLVRRTVQAIAGLDPGQIFNIGGTADPMSLGDRPLWVGAPAIVSHTPKALAVGDRVKVAGGGCARATIRAVFDDMAWVVWNTVLVCDLASGNEVRRLADLERADD